MGLGPNRIKTKAFFKSSFEHHSEHLMWNFILLCPANLIGYYKSHFLRGGALPTWKIQEYESPFTSPRSGSWSTATVSSTVLPAIAFFSWNFPCSYTKASPVVLIGLYLFGTIKSDSCPIRHNLNLLAWSELRSGFCPRLTFEPLPYSIHRGWSLCL